MVQLSCLLVGAGALSVASGAAIKPADLHVERSNGKPGSNSLLARQDFDNIDDMCGDKDLMTIDGAAEWWYDSAAGYNLDTFIRAEGEASKNWIKRLELRTWKAFKGDQRQDRNGSAGCATVGGNCDPYFDPGLTCEDFFEAAGNDYIVKSAYWIFLAARRMHEKFKVMNNELLHGTIRDALDIDVIVDDLGKPPEEPEIMKWFGLAIDVAGAALGKASPSAAIDAGKDALDALSLIAGNLPEPDDPEDIAKDLKAGLGKMFTETGQHLADTLALAMGAVDDDAAYETLPSFVGDGGTSIESDISKFFNTGLWLVDVDEDTGDDGQSRILKGLQSAVGQLGKQVADRTMKAAGWRLYVTRAQWGDKTGGEVFDWDGSRAEMTLARFENGKGVVTPSEEFFEKMKEHGIEDRKAYYRSLLECAEGKTEQDTETDWKGITWYGNLPKCFYQVEVFWCKNGRNAQQNCP